jgi:tripartite-type tricarboxylate transporter receptor subunit TctC
VRLIAASGPDGNPAVPARFLTEKFTTAFAKPFVVENVPSIGRIVAAKEMVEAAPDGHGLLFAAIISVALYTQRQLQLQRLRLVHFHPVLRWQKADGRERM